MRRRRPVVRFYRNVFDTIECWRFTRWGADRAIARCRRRVAPRPDIDQYRWEWMR